MPAVPSAVFNKRDRKHHLGEAILHVSSMRDKWFYRAAKRRAQAAALMAACRRRRAEKLSLDPPRAVRRAASPVGMVSARSIVAARRWPRGWISWATPSSADSYCQVVNLKCSATMLG